MLQRNTCGYPLDVRVEPAVRVWPGEDFDHPERLAGFTPVEELEELEPVSSDTTAKTGSTHSPAASVEGK